MTKWDLVQLCKPGSLLENQSLQPTYQKLKMNWSYQLKQKKYLSKSNTDYDETQKTRNKRELPQLDKVYLPKTPPKLTLYMVVKTGHFPRWATRQGCPVSPFLFKNILSLPASSVRQEKDIKCIQIEKKNKTKLLTDDMIVCIEIPKELEKKKKTSCNQKRNIAR